MWLLRESKGQVILEKNNLQTVQEWNETYIELTYMYTPPKKQSSSITVKSHNATA